jgi:mediator of RNA polymerase II transcription subunit 14
MERPSQWSISAALRIPIKGSNDVTYRFLESLEKIAAAFISHVVNARDLEQQNIHHRFAPSKALGATTSSSGIQTPDLYIRFSSLIKASWNVDVLQISFQGLATQDGHCTLIVLGRTKEPMTQLDSTNIAAEESDVSFHPQSGSYAIRFTVPVGVSMIPQLVEKLHRIDRLIKFVTIIRQFKLNCLHVSLGRIVFRHSETPELSVEIGFTGEDDQAMKLILPKDSPHIRIQKLLQNHLNTDGLVFVIKALNATLPLLLAIETIEASLSPTTQEEDFKVIVRSVDWFRLDYPKKKYVLDMRLRSKRDKPLWHIFDPGASGTGVPMSERAVCEAVKKMWFEAGDGWQGLKTGAAAEFEAVRDVLLKCHEAIWNAPPPQPQQMPQQMHQHQRIQGQAQQQQQQQQQQQHHHHQQQQQQQQR